MVRREFIKHRVRQGDRVAPCALGSGYPVLPAIGSAIDEDAPPLVSSRVRARFLRSLAVPSVRALWSKGREGPATWQATVARQVGA
jgi:hypothetical protein